MPLSPETASRQHTPQSELREVMACGKKRDQNKSAPCCHILLGPHQHTCRPPIRNLHANYVGMRCQAALFEQARTQPPLCSA